MKKILIAFLIFVKLPAALCQSNYWQQQVNYRIDVSLNDREHELDGFVKISYTNHSPDTLSFIWFHLWPNAYKNDQTAFSEQLLINGRTDFYFSDKQQKGYLNRLDFQVNGVAAKVIDHPWYIDVCKVMLPHPLSPGDEVEISTPFHEKLPDNFSGMGHIGQSYQVARWFPSPAVYDAGGWQEMPYLDPGGVYSEFGNFDVRITLPENYVVLASGSLQTPEEMDWLRQRATGNLKTATQPADLSKKPLPKREVTHKKNETPKLMFSAKRVYTDSFPASAGNLKTVRLTLENANDFAWFADKRFIVNTDTIMLSGHAVQLQTAFLPSGALTWTENIPNIKKALRFYSSLTDGYPYPNLSVVETGGNSKTGMAFPAVAIIPAAMPKAEFESEIIRQTGLIWTSALAGPDGRRYPWMTEGMNSYYHARYFREHPQNESAKTPSWIKNKSADDPEKLSVDVITKEKTDQSISTPSVDFSLLNYRLVALKKSALWMKQLEDSLGRTVYDSCMRRYFRNWMFKHPNPADFRMIVEQTSDKKLTGQFALLDKKGSLETTPHPKRIMPAFLFSQKNTEENSYVNFAPIAGYNLYDHVMIGAIIHNLNLPPENFQFFLVPLYATNSRQWNGIGAISYSWYPDTRFQKIETSIGASRFSSLSGIDSNGKKIFGGFYKITPALRFTLKNKDPRSTEEKWMELKTFLIGEKGFDYRQKTTDSIYYPVTQRYTSRYLNQLTLNVDDYRSLYPYALQLQVQQANEFYRINFTSNYFFNYSKGGGMDVRFFAAKFGYLGEKTLAKEFETSVYQPKLTATRGDEDYTYSNYFIGRNEASGFASQQVMIRDGGLKLRTDLFQDLQGRSDNWIAAMNFSTTLPRAIIPEKLPLKIFADIGTYADAWANNPPTSKFLWVGGLQLSLLKNIVNIYAPLIYSSDFRNNLKSVPEENTFWKKISFSIDLQNINFRKMFRNTAF